MTREIVTVTTLPDGERASVVSVVPELVPGGNKIRLTATEHFLDQTIPMRQVSIELSATNAYSLMMNLLNFFLRPPQD